MKIRGQHYRTIWPANDAAAVELIDQTLLPHVLEVRRLGSVGEVAQAIKTMQVRGAPLIGATAAYGVALAMQESGDDDRLQQVARILIATRPTAVNLRWAVERMAAAGTAKMTSSSAVRSNSASAVISTSTGMLMSGR